ncbi:MAG: hypothetical protein J0M02_08030 [Planctomycetes bacterium]|nr:hypothetical protein [Planctomycetota bacterium]
MKHTVPAILAIAALTPGLNALDVKDDDVKLGLTLQLQLRADVSEAEDAAGNDYDVMTGGANGGDAVDFYNRRMRFGLKGTYKGDYRFSVVFYGDKAQTNSQTIRLYESTITRVWNDEANGLSHEFKAGLSNAFYNGALGSYASASFLFAGSRASDGFGGSRGYGAGYLLTSKFGRFGADVQNNISDDSGTTGTPAVVTQSDGMFYSARVEISPPGELNIAKPAETFLGKEGKGVLLAADYMSNVRAANATTSTGYGIELLGHFDAITALAEYRTLSSENHSTDLTVDGEVWLVQAGYAMPLAGAVIEPAIRYQVIDKNTDEDNEGTSYGTSLDYGNSGTQIDLGVNYYIHGNNNKVQLSYTMWEGEEVEGGDAATADILRAQWQLWF